MQRCAVSLAGESRTRTASVLRSMSKGLRRPDNVPQLKAQGQAVGLLRKLHQPCEHVPLELPDGSVMHIATVWDRGDGDLLAIDPHSVAAPRSALGAFTLAAARARAGRVLTQAEVTGKGQRPISGPAAQGLKAWRAELCGTTMPPRATELSYYGGSAAQLRSEQDQSAHDMPLLLEDCGPTAVAELYADRGAYTIPPTDPLIDL